MLAATDIGPSRRQFLQLSAGLAALGLPRMLSAQEDTPKPVELDIVATGESGPGLERYDRLMASFMTRHEIPGAALAVTKDSRLVYARGFGYGDVEQQEAVLPTSLFRIGSVSKSITAVAVLQLVDRKKLSLNDSVVDLLKLTPHLGSGAKVDPRWRDVTVLHLLQHTGGWDKDKTRDPVSDPAIAKAFTVEAPVAPEQIVRYVMGRPLDFDPGQRSVYSNFGYLVLGCIIEAVTKTSYEASVRKEVLTPLGISMWPAAQSVEGRRRGEVRYYDPQSPQAPYEAIFHPAYGGWIASAVDLARFAAAFDNPDRCQVLSAKSIGLMFAPPAGGLGHEPDGKPKVSYYGCGWFALRVGDKGAMSPWHGGGLPGTAALVVRRFEHDGVNWAVVMNRFLGNDGEFLGNSIRTLLHDASTKIQAWPDGNLFSKLDASQ